MPTRFPLSAADLLKIRSTQFTLSISYLQEDCWSQRFSTSAGIMRVSFLGDLEDSAGLACSLGRPACWEQCPDNNPATIAGAAEELRQILSGMSRVAPEDIGHPPLGAEPEPRTDAGRTTWREPDLKPLLVNPRLKPAPEQAGSGLLAWGLKENYLGHRTRTRPENDIYLHPHPGRDLTSEDVNNLSGLEDSEPEPEPKPVEAPAGEARFWDADEVDKLVSAAFYAPPSAAAMLTGRVDGFWAGTGTGTVPPKMQEYAQFYKNGFAIGVMEECRAKHHELTKMLAEAEKDLQKARDRVQSSSWPTLS